MSELEQEKKEVEESPAKQETSSNNLLAKMQRDYDRGSGSGIIDKVYQELNNNKSDPKTPTL